MKKLLILSLFFSALTCMNEVLSSDWINYNRKALRYSLFGLGSSVAALGAYFGASSYQDKNFQSNKPIPRYIRVCANKNVPLFAAGGIYLFMQLSAINAETLDSAELNLLKKTDPEKYANTPKYYTDAPLYDGGRRVNEDGSYCDGDDYRGY